MPIRSLYSWSFAVLLLGVVRAAAAAELTVFVTGSMVDPLEHVAEDFTQATGHTLRFERATTGGLLAKIRAGERGDVVVIAAEAAVTLEQDGTLVAGSRTPIASSMFGVVVRAGSAPPDVATREAFSQAVLRARTISYPDPVAATVSGGYIETVLTELGIKDAELGQHGFDVAARDGCRDGIGIGDRARAQHGLAERFAGCDIGWSAAGAHDHAEHRACDRRT